MRPACQTPSSANSAFAVPKNVLSRLPQLPAKAEVNPYGFTALLHRFVHLWRAGSTKLLDVPSLLVNRRVFAQRRIQKERFELDVERYRQFSRTRELDCALKLALADVAEWADGVLRRR